MKSTRTEPPNSVHAILAGQNARSPLSSLRLPRALAAACCLFAATFVAVAQTPPPPAPPAPPAAVPAAPPPPAAVPAPVAIPAPKVKLKSGLDVSDIDIHLAPEFQVQMDALYDRLEDMKLDMKDSAAAMRLQSDIMSRVDAEAIREQAEQMKFDLTYQLKDLTLAPAFEESLMSAKEKLGRLNLDLAFAQELPRPMTLPSPAPMPAPAPAARLWKNNYGRQSDDRLYSEGQSALDGRHWDQALECFNQIITRNSPRIEGALFWKAYALNKLGRRDEGLSAIADLRKGYPKSRWLDDAKALEIELRQGSGQPVSPESENDDELKLMAINGLMQNDPDRAIPLLDAQLKGPASPRVRRNALFVLAQSSSPRAQAMLEQLARGAGNPDLQVRAISYLDARRRPNNAQILYDIYSGTSDTVVKRAALQSLASVRDKDRLLQIARSEKTPELREVAIGALSSNNGNPELWQLYQSETTTEGKILLLHFMHSNGNSDRLLEVVRTDKDPKVRVEAARALASQRSGVSADTLVSVYAAESDTQVKQSIVDSLTGQRNAKALIDIARAEKDTKLKLRIVERLSNMKSKEASDYLEELLKK